jgi:hypothetical protein
MRWPALSDPHLPGTQSWPRPKCWLVGIFTAPYIVGALIYVFTLPVVIIIDLLDQPYRWHAAP